MKWPKYFAKIGVDAMKNLCLMLALSYFWSVPLSALGSNEEITSSTVFHTGNVADGSEEPIEYINKETKSGTLVKADIEAEDGKVNWITVLAVCFIALLVYWINKKKKHEIE